MAQNDNGFIEEHLAEPAGWAKLLALTEPSAINALIDSAYRVKLDTVGPKVFFRGIVECSNICAKDCLYCGIRAGNRQVDRYEMSEDEMVEAALWAHKQDYGSVVIQAGERQDRAFTRTITAVLRRIKAESNGELGVTLSLGEQQDDVFAEWFEAGAHRYLLRIETSNAELYRRYHPNDHDFETRLRCLGALREQGYQVGTGVMIGLPGQTTAHLADDISFFRDQDIDMIGMGPYVPHQDTPLASSDDGRDNAERLRLGLNMIAVTRLVLKDVNIAATTALQALDPQGREQGLRAGANIVMPNLTDTSYRGAYQLYDGKPCLDENAGQCRQCLRSRIESIGETVGFNAWGDSPHFKKRMAREEGTA